MTGLADHWERLYREERVRREALEKRVARYLRDRAAAQGAYGLDELDRRLQAALGAPPKSIPESINALNISPESKAILGQIHDEVTAFAQERDARYRAARKVARGLRQRITRWRSVAKAWEELLKDSDARAEAAEQRAELNKRIGDGFSSALMAAEADNARLLARIAEMEAHREK